MEKLLIDDKLKGIYFKSSNAIAITTGKILTTDYNSPIIEEIRLHIKNSVELLDGRFTGQLLPVEKVDQTVIDNHLENSLNRTLQGGVESNETDSIVAESYKDILTKAADIGSSDIHIELYEHETQIYAGVDGERILLIPIVREHDYGKRLFSYIFTSAAKDKDSDYVAKTPNNGRLTESLLINGELRTTYWRASYIPADKGGKITLRWLNKDLKIPKLDSNGWAPGHTAMYRQFLQYPSGVCVIAGKVGSGKTTTIASGLSEIDKSRTVHCLEDPVEFNLGVMQTVVSPNKTINEETESRGFAYYSKVLLRHAVDIEMHGEVRDHAGAMEVTRKGETGQLVLTTVHTSSVIGIAPTFIEQFNIPPSVVSAPDLMRLWVYQTLIRTLCPDCSLTASKARSYYESINEVDKFNHWERHLNTLCNDEIQNVRFRNPNGCNHCGHKGEKGRTAVVEMIVLDDEDREFILNKDYLAWQVALKNKGFKDIRWHTITKIKAGIIDIDTASKRINNLLPIPTNQVYKMLEDSISIASNDKINGDTEENEAQIIDESTIVSLNNDAIELESTEIEFSDINQKFEDDFLVTEEAPYESAN